MSREVIAATKDDNAMVVSSPNQFIADKKIIGYPTGVNGRGIVVNARNTTLYNHEILHGNDDALCIIGDSSGSLVVNVDFPVIDWRPSFAKSMIGYCSHNSGKPGAIFRQPGACTFINVKTYGGLNRFRDGVWSFYDCELTVGHLSALDLIDPFFLNLVRVNFKVIPQPPGSGYWTGIPLRAYALRDGKQETTGLRSKVYIEECMINGKLCDPEELLPKLHSRTLKSVLSGVKL